MRASSTSTRDELVPPPIDYHGKTPEGNPSHVSPTQQSRLAYFRSISSELDARADRVRNLIGDAHWLSDGHHKEALLGGLLQRFLPSGIELSRGFVVTDEGEVSTEQDLLLTDVNTEPPLFRENGLSIATSKNVLAAISVKTSYTRKTLREALTGLASIPEPTTGLWYGAYWFDDSTRTLQNEAKLLRNRSEGLRIANPVYLRLSRRRLALVSQDEVRVNECPNTSTAFFTAQLLNSLTARSNNSSWFADALDLATGDQQSAAVER